MTCEDANAKPSLWRRIHIALVIVFVIWHLFVMFITNCRIEAPWLDASARRYEKFLYLDQSWAMFTSPLWTRSPFLAGRVHLSDGSSEDILSENEPANVNAFFRWGGFRHRKLEHLIRGGTKDRYTDAISQRYAESFAARWRVMHPNDARKVERVTLIERSYRIPPRGEPFEKEPAVTVTEIATYEITTDIRSELNHR